jgi:hypothetical protein
VCVGIEDGGGGGERQKERKRVEDGGGERDSDSNKHLLHKDQDYRHA